MATLTKQIEYLMQEFGKPYELEAEPDEEKVKVGEFSSKLALLYERLRNAVEYHEEHLIRRNAIARVLKRRLKKGAHGQDVSLPLVQELIRAQYLPNNAVPQHVVAGAAEIIDKYITLINKASADKRLRDRKVTFVWALGLMASELEEYLTPHNRERALVDAMYQVVRDEIVFLADRLNERERNIQLYLAVHRSLLKADEIWVRYQLLKLYYPEWKGNSPEMVSEVAGRFAGLRSDIEKTLKHSLAPYLARHLQPYAVLFWILKDILEKEPQRAHAIMSRSDILEDFIKEACQGRYQRSYKILRRSAVRAVIFILCTKLILAFVLELPYDIAVHGSVIWLPLAANVFFHPLVMLLIAATTRVPAEKNTVRVIEGVRWLVYGEHEEKILFKTKKMPLPYTIKGFLTNLFYAILYLLTFGLIFWVLNKFHFNIVSAGLFVFFLSIISFFGIRIRQSARELVVIDRKENVISTLFDFFTLPIVRAGRWISIKSSKINIFVFILDFVIEAPFKMLVEVFDDLIAFIREKKEEIM